MVCIYCGSRTQVINSRPQKRLNHIWRRRECTACRAVFTTSEIPDLLKSLLVKQGKHLKPFSRDKLFLSLYRSLQHRKQATNDASCLTDTVLSKIMPHIHNGVISNEQIVSVSLLVLKNFDKPAATHYLAFHPLDNFTFNKQHFAEI